jgi:aspartyl-tRNA(Asn)/glutamyl-tRNA(Gln) amidotransferase subunit A
MERRPVAQLDLGTLTVITCPDLLEVPPAPDLERVFKRSLATLESLGARVDERRLANADRFDEIFRVIQLREAWRVHADAELFPQHADGYGPDVRARLERAASISADAYAAAAGERESLRPAIAGLLGDGALLVTPVSGTAPVVAEQLGDGLALRDAVMRYTVPQNVTGIPSCALRAGFDDLGLPVGIQISAAPWRDNEVLAAAQAFFAATPEIQSRWPAVEE